MTEQAAFGRRQSDTWKAETTRMLGLIIGAITVLTIASKLFGIEVVGGDALKARVAKTEQVNLRQDTAITGVKSDIGALLQMTCRTTRRSDPEWLPSECDRVLSRAPR